MQNNTIRISDLFLPTVEHITFFPNILIISLAFLTHYNNIVEMFVVLILLLIVFILIFLYFKNKYGLNKIIIWFLPIPYLIFNLRQYENFLWGWQITFIFPLVFSFISFYLLDFSNKCEKRNSNYYFFIGAILSGTVATFSSAMGMLVWPIGLLQILITKYENKKIKKLTSIIWSVVGFIEIVFYYLLLKINSNPEYGEFNFKVIFNFLKNPILYLKKFLIIIGNSLFADKSNNVSLLMGVIIVIMLIICVIFIKKFKELNKNSFYVSLLTFSILTIMLITMGREDPIASRYISYSIYITLSLYLIFVNLNLKSKNKYLKIFPIALIAFFIINFPLSISEGIIYGQNNKILKLQNAFLLSTYKTQPVDAFHSICPYCEDKVEEYAPLLEKLGYNVFYRNLYSESNFANLYYDNTEPLLQIDNVSFFYFLDERIKPYDDTIVEKDNNIFITPYNEEAFLKINGWTVDEKNLKTASAVYLEFDNKSFPVFYGTERKDIANIYDNKNYKYSGFLRYLSLKEIGEGNHDIFLKIISYDKKKYYKQYIATVRLLSSEKKENINRNSFKIEDSSKYQINIDVYNPEEIISGSKNITGWIVDKKDKDFNDLTVLIYDGQDLIDENFIGIAKYFLLRKDVAKFFNAEEYRSSGFSFDIDTTKLQNGYHDIYIYML